MRRSVLWMAAGALLALPALASAQGVCANVAGSAALTPGLEAVPVTSGSFTFKDTNGGGTCAGENVWGGILSSGTLTAPSCNGNVHQGVTNGGAQFQGVCVGNTCDGGAVMGHAMSYQLVFDVATVQAAVDKCDPGDGDGGLKAASFNGGYASEAPH